MLLLLLLLLLLLRPPRSELQLAGAIHRATDERLADSARVALMLALSTPSPSDADLSSAYRALALLVPKALQVSSLAGLELYCTILYYYSRLGQARLG